MTPLARIREDLQPRPIIMSSAEVGQMLAELAQVRDHIGAIVATQDVIQETQKAQGARMALMEQGIEDLRLRDRHHDNGIDDLNHAVITGEHALSEHAETVQRLLDEHAQEVKALREEHDAQREADAEAEAERRKALKLKTGGAATTIGGVLALLLEALLRWYLSGGTP